MRYLTILLAVATLLPNVVRAQSPGAIEPSRATVEIRFRDDSRLKVLLKEEKLEFETRYGRLTIPFAEIQQVELGARVPEELLGKVQAAIKRLGSTEFKEREAAAAELMAYGVKALPALQMAQRDSDREVASRAEQVADKIVETASTEEIEQKPFDVLTTSDSKITGRIVSATLKVETTQFGPQTIKLGEALSIRSLNAIDDEGDDKKAEPDPGNLVEYRDKVGKTFVFSVTGANNGIVWGSDTYTSDSTLAAAAVHAGALRLGQTGLVRVKIVPAPPSFTGVERNGIPSHSWTIHPGAYQVLTKRALR